MSEQEHRRTRLITLGTQGGPTPRATRAQSANLLIVDGMHYVVDAGDGVARRLARAGISLRNIGTVFITHHHDDHTAGLGGLISAVWAQNRSEPFHVYGPPRTEELVDAAIRCFSISAEIRIADGGRSIPLDQFAIGHDAGSGEIFRDENIKVTAIENTHYRFHVGPTAGKYRSYSYRFQTPDRVIVFTGDTGPSDAVTELAIDADLLVAAASSFEDRMQHMIISGQWQAMTSAQRIDIERQATQGHMTPEMVGRMAARANVQTVVLTHLTHRSDGDYSRRANEVRQHFTGKVVVAEDLMTF